MSQDQKYALRKEDKRFLTGKGNFINDINLPGSHYVSFYRSEKAFAKITSIETSSAMLPGVLGIYSNDDIPDDVGEVPMIWPVEGLKNPGHPLLAKKFTRYIGEPILIIIAETHYLAELAANKVVVTYEEYTPISNFQDAISNKDKIRIHQNIENNLAYSYHREFGEKSTLEQNLLFTKQTLVIPRVAALPLETRGIVSMYDKTNDILDVWSSTQFPHVLRLCLSQSLAHQEQKINVTSPDVGGAFGAKMNVYREEILVAYFSKKLCLPLKYIESRTEHFMATTHGRDQIQDVKVYYTHEGVIKGLQVTLHANMGAYLQAATTGMPIYTSLMLSGCYDIPYIDVSIKAYYTNQTPTDAYRGAGRPEAVFLIERIIDIVAYECKLDPIKVRKKNFINVDSFPKKVATGLTYDSGDYEASLDKLITQGNLEKWREVQKVRRENNSSKQIGVGFSTYVEFCGSGPSKMNKLIGLQAGGFESATVRILSTGSAEVISGTCPTGQGHHTSFSLLLKKKMGYELEEVHVVTSKASANSWGSGTFGSRSLAVGGSAIIKACDKILEKCNRFLSLSWGIPIEKINFSKGQFHSLSGHRITLKELAGKFYLAHDLPSGIEPGLEATVFFDPENFTFPFGAHMCVIEIDRETGERNILEYHAVDDCGPVIHEKLVEGQVLGGIVQGIGEALSEEIIYEKNTGNLLTNSFRTYGIPKTTDIPPIYLYRTETPTNVNPLGAKGVGEAGAIAAPAAVMNAVIDSLKPNNIRNINMPATQEKIWESLFCEV